MPEPPVACERASFRGHHTQLPFRGLFRSGLLPHQDAAKVPLQPFLIIVVSKQPPSWLVPAKPVEIPIAHRAVEQPAPVSGYLRPRPHLELIAVAPLQMGPRAAPTIVMSISFSRATGC